MEDHVFQLLAIVGTVVSIVTLPLVAALWQNMNRRVDTLEAEAKSTVKQETHAVEIARIERAVERVEDRVQNGFSDINKRMDTLFALITKKKGNEST